MTSLNGRASPGAPPVCFSSSNANRRSRLAKSIAFAKTSASQHAILTRNPLLKTISKEVTSDKLLDLLVVKCCAVGEVLWHCGQLASDVCFVVSGGLVVSSRLLPSQAMPQQHPIRHEEPTTREEQEQADDHFYERVFRAGGYVGAKSVASNQALAYTIATIRLKSMVLLLPKRKFHTILHQLSDSTREHILKLIDTHEQDILTALHLTIPGNPCSANGSARIHAHGTAPGSPTDHQRQSAAASALALASIASWESLKVEKPVEYEVNSALLVLHNEDANGDNNNNNNNTKQFRVAIAKPKAQEIMMLAQPVREVAKKHTQRRLESIKLPQTVNPFPKGSLARCKSLRGVTNASLPEGEDLSVRHAHEAAAAAFGFRRSASATSMRTPRQVVSSRIGRLLKPLSQEEIDRDRIKRNKSKDEQEKWTRDNLIVHAKRTANIRCLELDDEPVDPKTSSAE